MPRHPDSHPDNEINTIFFTMDTEAGSDEEPVPIERSSLDELIAAGDWDDDDVTFEDALEAITGESLAPQELAGFNDISRKQIHELRRVWPTLEDDARRTIAETTAALGDADLRLDFFRFFRVLLEDTLAEVRQIAVTALEAYDDPDLLPALIGLAQNDESDDVRVAALTSLRPVAVMADDDMLDLREHRALRTALTALVTDTSVAADVRAAALATAALDTQIPDLDGWVRAFYEQGDDRLRIGAVEAMGASASAAWLPQLERSIRSHDIDEREAAADALGRIDDAAAVPMLTMVVREDSEGAVRVAAIQALGVHGSREAVRALETLREHVSDDERDLVVDALADAAGMLAITEGDDVPGLEFETYPEDDD